MLLINSGSDIFTLPIAIPIHNVFFDFNWNLTVAFWSSTFALISSLLPKTDGNLPALFKPGPIIRGIWRMSEADAKNASYVSANFLIAFLFLFNFFKSSAVKHGNLLAFASPSCFASPKIQTNILDAVRPGGGKRRKSVCLSLDRSFSTKSVNRSSPKSHVFWFRLRLSG